MIINPRVQSRLVLKNYRCVTYPFGLVSILIILYHQYSRDEGFGYSWRSLAGKPKQIYNIHRIPKNLPLFYVRSVLYYNNTFVSIQLPIVTGTGPSYPRINPTTRLPLYNIYVNRCRYNYYCYPPPLHYPI